MSERPDSYFPIIGLEIHAHLLTESKIFCGCSNEFGAEPNSNTCPVCLGLPGALPVLNEKAIELAVRAILALDGIVTNYSILARKNYFYPDLPKGYQISQFDAPIGVGGTITYTNASGETSHCHLKRIHLEEDAGKSLHPEHDEPMTRIDLNRCGAPLIEIVTEPDLHSPADAHACLATLRQMVEYLDVCTGEMEKGHLRCDANVSIGKNATDLTGTRTEVKNMNSFKSVERALQFEIDRQIEVLQSGGSIQQATLLWNEKEQRCELMRTKEDSPDYRYFPEPDLLDITVSADQIEQIKAELVELPVVRATRFVEQYGVREYDAAVLTGRRDLADYFEMVMENYNNGRTAANWIQTELLGLLSAAGETIAECHVTPEALSDLLTRLDKNDISTSAGKIVLSDMLVSGKKAAVVIEEKNLAQVSDESTLVSVIDEVITAHPDNVEKYRSGKTGLLDFFVGQVMRQTRGSANPNVVRDLLKAKLDA